jgi:predicted negative regulator of RcsB-dependent stress response
MRLRGSWIPSVFALVVICVVGWTVYGQKQQPSAHKATWEYKIVNSLSEAQLNQLGSEGWELVAVAAWEGNAQQYLKRAK